MRRNMAQRNANSGKRRGRKRVRLNARGKLLVLVLLLFVLFIATTTTALGSGSKVPDPENYTRVEVVSGDTLWSLASCHAGEKTDIRRFIFEICKINQISAGEDIYPGQVLLFPVEG